MKLFSKKTLVINGVPRTVIANPDELLVTVIRKQLGLTGTKVGCGQGQCGACNVIMDGKLIRSCITKMERVPDGAAITTIEGIGTPQDLHALQMAWMIHGGAQCGFCTPGLIMSAVEIVGTGKRYSREELRKLISGHLCRCTGYESILNALERVVDQTYRHVGKE